jgi:mRNA interferase RelE/StbE
LAEPRLTARAKADLAALPRSVQEAVIETMALLGAEPSAAGKPLVGRLAGLWSARVGNYRILYTIEDGGGSSRATVRAIRHRGVVYRTRPN